MGIIIAFIKKYGLIIISFFTKRAGKIMPVAVAAAAAAVAGGTVHIRKKKAIEKHISKVIRMLLLYMRKS